jgi:hypothetical protein
MAPVLRLQLLCLLLGGGGPAPAHTQRQPPPKCGNQTADLPCEVFLHGNLCDDKDLIGGVAAGTLSSCFAACHAVPSCEYFGMETTPHPWCIRYKNCAPRRDPAGSSTYTTYAMTARAGRAVPPPPPLIEETFWQITDIHLNPDYPKGCPSPCGTFADHFCGASPALYTAAVQFMAEQNAHERIRPPAFVAHTGDMPDLPGGNISAMWALARWQADALYQQFPVTPVFFAFGNHDFDPGVDDDCPYLPGCATHYAAVCGAFGRDLDEAAPAVGETIILLHSLPLVGVSIAMERERQQNDSLANG